MQTMTAAAQPPDHCHGFDYETLEPPIAEVALAAASAIRANMQHVRECIFEIGRQLVYIRDVLMPQQFGEWVQKGCGFSWATACRFMAVYERLGGDEFRNLRNCSLAATTLYKLAEKRTPAYVRHEIAEAIERGEIKIDASIESEIKRRIDEAKRLGLGQARPSASQQKAAHRAQLAIEARRMLERALGDDFSEFRRLYNRSGRQFDQVLNARQAGVTRGLLNEELISDQTGLPLTDDELQQYLIVAASPKEPDSNCLQDNRQRSYNNEQNFEAK